jgi:chromosome segregation ATPase
VSVHTCQEQQSLHKHLTKRAELISAIDDEKAKKKDHQSLMKKMRKDHSKHLVAVKAEMEQLKRSVNKDEIHQAKMISRIPVLHDSIKTAKRSIDSLKRDLDGEENMKQSIGVELDSLSARWQGDREEVERLESMLKLQKSENDAVIEEISEELSQLTRKAGEQHEKLMFLDHESRDVEKKITELDVLVKDEKANGSQLDKRLKEETKHLTRIVSDSDARNALIQENIARMERERAHITQQLEFERNELVQLDSELMMKRNPPYYGHTSGNFSFYNNKNTNNTNKSGN